MTSSPKFRPIRTGSSATFAAAGVGAVAVMGLIPLTSATGEWWLLAATFAALLATAGLVMLGLFGMLAQSGDAQPAADLPIARVDTATAGVPVPVLRAA